MLLRRLSVLCLALALPLSAQAQDAQLYDPTPPADASFVRIINATGKDNPKGTIGTEKYNLPTSPVVSSYAIIQEGDKDLVTDSGTTPLKVEAGKYYTIALLPEGQPKVLEDTILANPSKSMIYFYNLSDIPSATLRATAQNADVVADVKAGESASREINALTIKLAAVADGKEVVAFDETTLKRRNGFAYVLAGTAGNYKALVVENSVKPVE